jgi:pyruvate kinase
MNKTKIIATYGPACSKSGVIDSLISAGVNLFRFNASHEKHEDMQHDIKKVREAAQKLGKNVGIMVDLQGPKLRIGDLPEDGIRLKEGERVSLVPDMGQAATFKAVPLGNPDLIDDLKTGHRIYLDDGEMELRVISVKREEVVCKVVLGGILKSRKGINLPDTNVSMPTILPKDVEDIKFSIKNDVDWLAISFVRSPDEINIARKMVADRGSNIRIIAKIEKYEAVSVIDSIIEAADAIMVARGDLGVEIAAEDVPLLQKRIIEECLKVGKPTIVATQMLNSMILNPRPTRAEVSDVANAVFDSADALMLSGETSVGKYPVESVEMMARICHKAESFLNFARMLGARSQWVHKTIPEAVSFAACKIACDLNVRAIITSTQSGLTARKISRYRPAQPVIACSQNQFVVNQLTLSWGVVPIKTEHASNIDEMLDLSLKAALDKGEISRDDVVVITAGVMVNIPGSTNLIKVHQV